MTNFAEKYELLKNHKILFVISTNNSCCKEEVENWFAQLEEFVNGNEYYELKSYRGSWNSHNQYLNRIRKKLEAKGDDKTVYYRELHNLGCFFHRNINSSAEVRQLLANLEQDKNRIISNQPSFLQQELKNQNSERIFSYLKTLKEANSEKPVRSFYPSLLKLILILRNCS